MLNPQRLTLALHCITLLYYIVPTVRENKHNGVSGALYFYALLLKFALRGEIKESDALLNSKKKHLFTML